MKNSQKPKDLPLKELIKDISSKGVDHLTIQVLFDLLLKIAIEYTDYYESDLGEFLFTKLFKKFYIYISLRILIIIGYLTSLYLFRSISLKRYFWIYFISFVFCFYLCR